MKRRHFFHRAPSHRRLNQRGVVLLFSLIAMVIMLIGAVALVRSFQSSLFSAGNVGFKRDMRNQSELAVSAALTAFRAGGGLNTVAQRASDLPANNYSASMLPTDVHGIPTALALSNSAFAAIYTATDLPAAGNSIQMRYVIDRLCSSVGDEKTLGPSSCVLSSDPPPSGTSVLNLRSAERQLGAGGVAAVAQSVVYRLTVRVTGPRSTQSFFQTTFSVPS